MAVKTAPLSDDQTANLAEMFRLLGDPSRLRIVLATLDAPLPVGDIAKKLNLSQSLVSHHLRLLRAARLVRHERKGRQIHYHVHDHHVACVIDDMVAHVREVREAHA
ncbi:MAG: metalloregulator ArsR/SmtB family transcription factor [Parvibaculaceae bacterium]